MSAQTLGSLRINRGFNPSKDPKIDEIKQKAGELVDVIENIDPSTIAEKSLIGEVKRLKCLAQTHLEIASMFGVKAQALSQSWSSNNS